MKIIKSITAILLVIAILLSFNLAQSSKLSDDTSVSGISIDEVIFPHDEVIKVSISVDESDYQNMLDNAENEESIMADINYNGYEFSSISIRPKGNSSLKSVAKSDSDRYSFKIDFDDYIDEQSFLGIEQINLNNLFSDPSMMAEYLSYEMFDELDAVSSRTTYCELYINDEYVGLYLAVEEVEEEFLIENYESANGELYKPEMGDGSDLVYTTDLATSYSGLESRNAESDNEEIIELMKRIDSKESVDDIFNVDSFLKYLAISTLTVHLDSYQGNMFHNFYLYNDEGVFQWIPWDLNMTFNGFPMAALTDEEASGLLIYEPVSGNMDSYPLVEYILSNPDYVEIYDGYMQELMQGYLSDESFETRVLEVYEMINSYVKVDPSSFYSYEEFENALFNSSEDELSILDFMSKRIDNVELQMSGEIASTNNGNGNVGTAEGKMGDKNMTAGGPPMDKGGEENKNFGPPQARDGESNQNKDMPDRPAMNGEDMKGDFPMDIAENTENQVVNYGSIIISSIAMIFASFIIGKRRL